MDYMMVDVTHIPDAAIHDHALLFGEDEFGTYLPPEELASSGGSIVHELMTCLGPRIQRLFIYDESCSRGEVLTKQRTARSPSPAQERGGGRQYSLPRVRAAAPST